MSVLAKATNGEAGLVTNQQAFAFELDQRFADWRARYTHLTCQVAGPQLGATKQFTRDDLAAQMVER